MSRRIRRTLSALLVGAATVMAGCGSGSGSSNTTPAASGGPTHYPVTVTDCGGRRTTFASAPRRVVTIDPNLTEMLLVLGLKDRIAGFTQFYTPDREWAPVKAQMDGLTVINRDFNYPSREAIVARQPDLVASIYTYAFQNPLPTRSAWSARGVNTYLAVGDCGTGGVRNLTPLYEDLRNLGTVFDVASRADAEIASLRRQVAAQRQRARAAGLRPRRIAVADGTMTHPPSYGGSFNAVVGLAGSRNIFRDVPQDQVPSWEQFVAADPDVIWVVPDAGLPVATIESKLESDPRTRNVTGVRRRAFIVIPQADATVESPRLVDGLTKLVTGLITLKRSGR